MNTPIPSLAALRAVEAQPQLADPRGAQVGEQLRLLVALAADGALVGRTARGQSYPLPAGLAQPGEELLLRVLATQPRLELQMLERRVADPAALVAAAMAARAALAAKAVPAAPAVAALPAAMPEDTAALRTDQAWLQQRFPGARVLPGQVPAMPAMPAELAAQWRGRVLAEALRTPAEPVPAARASAGAEAVGAAEAVRLQGVNGQVLFLRLLHPQPLAWPPPAHEEDDGAESPPEKKRERPPSPDEPDDAGEGLRLGLILSLNGEWVQVVLQWQAGGVLLHLSAEQAATQQQLRGLLPRVAAALAAVPLPLRHVQIGSRPPAMPPLPAAQQGHGLAHASSHALFRAAAEVAGVLQA